MTVPHSGTQPIPLERVRKLQRRLYSSAKADPKKSYGVLYDKVYRRDVLQVAWRQVAGNRGSAGVDQQSIEWIKGYGVEKYLEEIGEALNNETYYPKLIRRAYIDKSDGRKRPLGIPTVTDRVVQAAAKIVMEPLFEADFEDSSHGFRPRRNAHDAIHQIDELLRRGYRWVVDVDFEKYFETIPQEPLMQLVQRRVHDPKLLRLVRGWLKAGILEDGAVNYPETGTPQGGVLSPLLSNIYLHEVDREWRERCPRAQMVRYADDLVILCPTEADAQCEHAALQAAAQKLGLRLNAEKTRVVATREGFDFLGFSFRRGFYVRNGKQREIIIKVPRSRAIKTALARLKDAVKRVPLGEVVVKAVQAVNRRLRGWINYFRIGNVEAVVRRLVWHAGRQLRVFLRRKYHRKRCQNGQRWPDSYFHQHLGLYTVTQLLGKGGAQC